MAICAYFVLFLTAQKDFGYECHVKMFYIPKK